jgi:hypothetical protein
MKSSLPRFPRVPHRFDKSRDPDYKSGNSDHSNDESFEQVILDKKDGPQNVLETNTIVQTIEPTEEQREVIETKQTVEKDELIPQVSSGGLILPPRGPNHIATDFDMSKDEWTLGEILDLRITAIPFLVDKLIPMHTLNVLAGQSERGKSTLYTQLSLAIIRGDDEFLGCKLYTNYKRVLIISTEDGPVALSFRTNKQLNQATSINEYRDRLTFIINQDNLENRIEDFLIKTRVDLVVMDAFGDVFTGRDINASNSVRQYLGTYVKLIQKYGCSVLFVHHIGKSKQNNRSEKDQLLGSVGIEGKTRNVMMLSIINDQHQLSIVKGNYINREDRKTPLYLNFDSDTLTFSLAEGPAKPEEGKEGDIDSTGGSTAKSKPGPQKDMEKYNLAIKLHKEGKSQVEIAQIVGRDKSTICKWIKEHKANQNPPPNTPAV